MDLAFVASLVSDSTNFTIESNENDDSLSKKQQNQQPIAATQNVLLDQHQKEPTNPTQSNLTETQSKSETSSANQPQTFQSDPTNVGLTNFSQSNSIKTGNNGDQAQDVTTKPTPITINDGAERKTQELNQDEPHQEKHDQNQVEAIAQTQEKTSSNEINSNLTSSNQQTTTANETQTNPTAEQTQNEQQKNEDVHVMMMTHIFVRFFIPNAARIRTFRIKTICFQNG